MNDILPPSKYGTGTTYEGDGSIKNIVSPDNFEGETYKIPVNRPRIVRESGSIALTGTVMETLSSPQTTLGDAYGHLLQPAQLSDKSDMHTGSSQTPNQREQALDLAEVQNKVRAAEAAGMTVDQWNANGRPMKGTYSGK